jgi:hypothetical protein
VKLRVVAIACAIVFCLTLSGPAAKNSAELTSIDKKIAHLEANARAAHPDESPTVLSEKEINAYLASDDVELPAGVQSVVLSGAPGTISGTAKVDFDKVREGVHSSNPLLSIFSGIHDVQVETHAYGQGGQGYVHVDSVALDGMVVPQFVLRLFVEKYIAPKYPNLGIDSKFALPDRIDSAVVGQHQVTLIQK